MTPLEKATHYAKSAKRWLKEARPREAGPEQRLIDLASEHIRAGAAVLEALNNCPDVSVMDAQDAKYKDS